MTSYIDKLCTQELNRLNRRKLTAQRNNDLTELNRIYNDLDFYNYYKNYKRLSRALQEDLDSYEG